MLHENAFQRESQESLHRKSPEAEQVNYDQPLEFQMESLISDVPNIQEDLEGLYEQLGGSFDDLSPQTRSRIEQFKKHAGKLARNAVLAVSLSMPTPAYGNRDFLHPHEAVTDENVTLQEMGVREQKKERLTSGEKYEQNIQQKDETREQKMERAYRYLSKEEITDPSMARLVEKASEGITENFEEELEKEFKNLTLESKNEYMYYVIESNDGSWELLPMANMKNATNEIGGNQISIGGGSVTLPISLPELIKKDNLKTIYTMHNHNKYDIEKYRSDKIAQGAYSTVDRDALDFPPSLVDLRSLSEQMHANSLSHSNMAKGKVTTSDGIWSYSKDNVTVYDEIQQSVYAMTPDEMTTFTNCILGDISVEQAKDSSQAIRSVFAITTEHYLDINESEKKFLKAKDNLIFGEGEKDEEIKRTIKTAKKLGFDLEYKPY